MRTLLIAALLAAPSALAADHAEAPGTQADPAADIADLYAWYSGTDVTFALTFAGLTAAGGDATYDADVLYQIHIDNDADNLPDHSIDVRFGQDGDGNWGVQAALPDGSMLQGAVGSNLMADGNSLYAGLRDDPFFFDLAGFNATLDTATVAFDSTRDSLAGTNVTSVVVEVDRSTIDGGGDVIAIWATSSRI